jgi:hypothetical protein
VDICRVFDDGDDFCFCGFIGFGVDNVCGICGENSRFFIVSPSSDRFSFHCSDGGEVKFSSYLESSLVSCVSDASSGFTPF